MLDILVVSQKLVKGCAVWREKQARLSCAQSLNQVLPCKRRHTATECCWAKPMLAIYFQIPGGFEKVIDHRGDKHASYHRYDLWYDDTAATVWHHYKKWPLHLPKYGYHRVWGVQTEATKSAWKLQHGWDGKSHKKRIQCEITMGNIGRLLIEN